MSVAMQRLKEGSPVIFGDGENRRSMTQIPALVDAMMRVIDQPSTSSGETYWITDEQPYTTNHV
jgi:nucleoside-diphosphate-sugar epimerase